MKKLKSYSSRHVKLWSYFNMPFLSFVAWLMTSKKTIELTESDIQPDKNYVFAINHQGAFDFLAVFYSIPKKLHDHMAPYRFFTANRFFRFPILKWTMMSFGCFPAKKHKKLDYGLPAAERAMNRGESVVIFPEGKVSHIDRKYRPKRGVEVLAKTPNTMIIPVRVKWQRKKGFFKGYSLTVGRPFDGHLMSAEQIMDEVYDLRFKE